MGGSEVEIVFPQHWTRSDRRRHSRQQARRYARYGIQGQPHGRPAVYPPPPKPRPASPRSGQARVNRKRNERAAFLEHLIALTVSVELADACPDFEQRVTGLLPGRAIRRDKDPMTLRYIYRMHIPDAPDGAATMNPLFRLNGDLTVSVTDIEWWRADGTYIGSNSGATLTG
jgi:hypothetical protein